MQGMHPVVHTDGARYHSEVRIEESFMIRRAGRKCHHSSDRQQRPDQHFHHYHNEVGIRQSLSYYPG
jgi:hypothetical protein